VQILKPALTRERDAQLAHAALCPNSFQSSHGALRILAEPHRCVNQDVVEMSVRVEIKRQEVGMTVALEGLPGRAPASQLGAIDAQPAADMRYERAV
jgi:hypothetical protein